MNPQFRVFFNYYFEGIAHPCLFNIRFREPPKDTLIIEEARKLLPDFESEEVMHFAWICKHLNDMKMNQKLSSDEFDIVYPQIVGLGIEARAFSSLSDVAAVSRKILLQHALNGALEHKNTHKVSHKL